MGLFGGINAVNEINSLIAQIERNMNALAPMIELNGMKHTTQSKELTKLVRRDLDRIKDLLNQHSSARIAVYRLKGCLLYTSDAADDLLCVDLGGRRSIKKKTQRN